MPTWHSPRSIGLSTGFDLSWKTIFCHSWTGGSPELGQLRSHHEHLCSARAKSWELLLIPCLQPGTCTPVWISVLTVSLTTCVVFICIFYLAVTVLFGSQVWWFQTSVFALPDKIPRSLRVYSMASPFLSWAIWKAITLAKARSKFSGVSATSPIRAETFHWVVWRAVWQMIFISWVFIHPRLKQWGLFWMGRPFWRGRLQGLIKTVQFWIFQVFAEILTINAFGRYSQKFFMCKP